jgi:hypothetical protein
MDEFDALIHDEDLRTQLADARKKGFMWQTMARVLVNTQERRDKERAEAAAHAARLAALPREKRRRAIIRGVFENAAPSPADVRHMHSVLAVCGLPHSREPIEVREFERKQGNMALDISAGYLRTPTGEKIAQPLPFGPKARLILMHLCSEAIRQKSAKIEIAETFTAFVREMGYDDAGGPRGSLTAFREQLNALAACSMRISAWTGEGVRTRKIDPIEEFDLWLSADHRQRSLWPSTLTFSAPMFESLQRHALPVNIKAVRAFAGSARKLDIYFWLGYRMHNIDDPLHISWKALGEQFGTGFGRERKFREKFKSELADITEVFPKLPVKLSEKGLILHPAGPEVLALPTPKPARKRGA